MLTSPVKAPPRKIQMPSGSVPPGAMATSEVESSSSMYPPGPALKFVVFALVA